MDGAEFLPSSGLYAESESPCVAGNPYRATSCGCAATPASAASRAAPAAKVPSCPPCLGEEARKEWQRLSKELSGSGCSPGSIATCSRLTAKRMRSGSRRSPRSQRYGTMVKSPNGYPMQSPYVAVANKQVEIMVRIAAEFGMTPSSRTRIRVGDKPPEDPFEAFLQDRG